MGVTKYRKPPIIERVISHGFSMPEEQFQPRLSSWSDVVRKAFPQSHIANNWEISIAEKNGIPYIPRESQKFTAKYQFWKGKKADRDRGLQVWRDRVAFNLLSQPKNPRTYEELHGLYQEWLPAWADHFGVENVRGVTIEYVNILAPATVPKFCKGGRINVGEILTAFVAPGPLKNLVAPFTFEMNFDAHQKDFPLHLHTELKALPKAEVALRLLFRASTEAAGREIALDALAREIDTAHCLIRDEFEAFFTDAAKATFEPYDIDTAEPGT